MNAVPIFAVTHRRRSQEQKEILMRCKPQLEWLLIGLALALCPVGASGGDFDNESADGLDVFFRDTELASLAKQELAIYSVVDAGESERIDRLFPDAPPQIPHSVEDMFSISPDGNDCLDCHHPENAGSDDIPIPKTHFRRAVMAGGSKSDPMVWVVKGFEDADDLVGTRFNCSMCHVPVANNARVIENNFKAIQGKPTQ
jgi:nitrate reductase cytochrome c-type subunit